MLGGQGGKEEHSCGDPTVSPQRLAPSHGCDVPQIPEVAPAVRGDIPCGRVPPGDAAPLRFPPPPGRHGNGRRPVNPRPAPALCAPAALSGGAATPGGTRDPRGGGAQPCGWERPPGWDGGVGRGRIVFNPLGRGALTPTGGVLYPPQMPPVREFSKRGGLTPGVPWGENSNIQGGGINPWGATGENSNIQGGGD